MDALHTLCARERGSVLQSGLKPDRLPAVTELTPCY